MLEYIQKNNIIKNFNMINIDKLKEIPKNITIVPTIIDPKIEAPLEGRKAFEFIINQKYFYHPTNNIDYWVKNCIPKPVIDEDAKAIERHNFAFANFNDEKPTVTKEEPKKIQVSIDRKTLALMKLRR
jgi:hypothetical protein